MGEECLNHIIYNVLCYNIIDEVLNISSNLINLNNNKKLKILWLNKLNINLNSSTSLSSSSASSSLEFNNSSLNNNNNNKNNERKKNKKHYRLLEECENYNHPCSYFGKPNYYMERPIIEFNSDGVQLEYILMKVI